MVAKARALLLSGLYARLTTIEEALIARGWEVDACLDPQEAIEHLQTRDYWSIFSDEVLKGASPSGFLAWTARLAPRVPFYLFCGDPDAIRFVGVHRPYGFLSYPPNVPTLPGPVGATEYDRSNAKMPLQGSTEQVPLADLLEMLGMTQRDAVVALQGEVRGSLHIQNGLLTHAVSRSRSSQVGIRALTELLQATDLEYKVLTYQPPERSTVRMRITNALTEAAKIADEQQRDGQLLDAVTERLPFVRAAVTGYPLAQSPSLMLGEGAGDLFTSASRLLERQRDLLGAVTHQAVESDSGAIALVRYGEGNLLAVRVPRGKSLVALSALVKILRELEGEA